MGARTVQDTTAWLLRRVQTTVLATLKDPFEIRLVLAGHLKQLKVRFSVQTAELVQSHARLSSQL